MRFLILLLMALFLQISYCQKSIKVTFIDSISNEPIPFLFVENTIDSTSEFTNLDGSIKLRKSNTINTFLLSHISYGNQYIALDLTKDNIVSLAPLAIGLEEVVVRDVRRDIEEMLTDVLKHLRKDKTIYHSQYAFYLETKYKDKAFEKIKSVFKTTYNHNTGIKEESFMDGEFWFNPDSLFINLDMDTWLLGFDPFAKKDKDLPHYLLTNGDKIKKNKHKVSLMECNHCPQGYELFSIQDEAQSIKLIANLESKKIINFQVTLKPTSKLFFINLISKDTSKVNGVNLNYIFSQDGNLQKIIFKLNLNDRLNRALNISGFFNKVDYIQEKKIYYFGKYRPKSLYEKILMDPNVNRYRIDTLFNKDQYEAFDVNQSAGLWSNDEQIRNYFFSKGTFNNQIRMWNVDRKLDLNHAIFSNAFYDNDATRMPSVTWIFSFDKSKNKWASLPSIWSTNRNIVFLNSANNVRMAMELAFDHMEIARLNCNPIDSAAIRSWYSAQKQVIHEQMNLIMNDYIPLESLYKLNYEVFDKWGIDNIKDCYIRNIPTMLKYPKEKNFAERFAQEAHQMKEKGNHTMSSNFSLLSIDLLTHLLTYFSNNLDNKKLGSTHIILAEQFHLLQKKEEACHHFAAALQVWPEANKSYPKKNLMALCGVK